MSDDLRSRDDDFDDSIRPRQTDGSVPPKSSKKWLWIILGIGAASILLCCVLGGVGSYFGLSAGGKIIAQGVQDEPAVQENIGTISDASIAVMRTGELAETEPGVMVIEMTGDKGSGELLLKQSPGGERFEDVRLLMPDGTEYPLRDFTLNGDGSVDRDAAPVDDDVINGVDPADDIDPVDAPADNAIEPIESDVVTPAGVN